MCDACGKEPAIKYKSRRWFCKPCYRAVYEKGISE